MNYDEADYDTSISRLRDIEISELKNKIDKIAYENRTLQASLNMAMGKESTESEFIGGNTNQDIMENDAREQMEYEEVAGKKEEENFHINDTSIPTKDAEIESLRHVQSKLLHENELLKASLNMAMGKESTESAFIGGNTNQDIMENDARSQMNYEEVAGKFK